MIFRGLTNIGDWKFGRGKASYATDEEAIALEIYTRIKSYKNDCFFDYDTGIDWVSRLDKNQKNNLINDLSTLILQTYGVMKINSVTANLDNITRHFSVEYNIDTIYSQNFTQQISIAAGTQGA